MKALRQELQQVAQFGATVLLQGETGTGKDTAARLLHQWSGRAAGPFLQVDLACLTPMLIHGALYGHEQYASPINARCRTGSVELARGGTVYLDDIDAVPQEAQSYLNPILKERTLERVDARRHPLDARGRFHQP
jgi:DNA-binding NtrC family response regulator